MSGSLIHINSNSNSDGIQKWLRSHQDTSYGGNRIQTIRRRTKLCQDLPIRNETIAHEPSSGVTKVRGRKGAAENVDSDPGGCFSPFAIWVVLFCIAYTPDSHAMDPKPVATEMEESKQTPSPFGDDAHQQKLTRRLLWKLDVRYVPRARDHVLSSRTSGRSNF